MRGEALDSMDARVPWVETDTGRGQLRPRGPVRLAAERGGQVGGGRLGAEGHPALVPPHERKAA